MLYSATRVITQNTERLCHFREIRTLRCTNDQPLQGLLLIYLRHNTVSCVVRKHLSFTLIPDKPRAVNCRFVQGHELTEECLAFFCSLSQACRERAEGWTRAQVAVASSSLAIASTAFGLSHGVALVVDSFTMWTTILLISLTLSCRSRFINALMCACMRACVCRCVCVC